MYWFRSHIFLTTSVCILAGSCEDVGAGKGFLLTIRSVKDSRRKAVCRCIESRIFPAQDTKSLIVVQYDQKSWKGVLQADLNEASTSSLAFIRVESSAHNLNFFGKRSSRPRYAVPGNSVCGTRAAEASDLVN